MSLLWLRSPNLTNRQSLNRTISAKVVGRSTILRQAFQQLSRLNRQLKRELRRHDLTQLFTLFRTVSRGKANKNQRVQLKAALWSNRGLKLHLRTNLSRRSRGSHLSPSHRRRKRQTVQSHSLKKYLQTKPTTQRSQSKIPTRSATKLNQRQLRACCIRSSCFTTRWNKKAFKQRPRHSFRPWLISWRRNSTNYSFD